MTQRCLPLDSISEPPASDLGPAEEELIRRALKDPDAFATLYRMHYPCIAAYIHRRTGQVEATEDLVSEVFTAALKRLPRFEAHGAGFRAWLYRIATNAVNQWARRAARRQRREHAHARRPENHGHDNATPAARRDDVREALLRLKPKHQEVLALHYVEGLGIEQVARVLGRPEGTIKSRLLRARAALREALKERPHDEKA